MLQKIIGILLLLNFGSAFGDYLEVTRSATIKASPESGTTIYERPAVGTEYVLLQDGQTNGYYQIWSLQASRPGWIYRTLVRRHSGTSPNAIGQNRSTQAGFDGENCGEHLGWGIPHASDQILCRRGYAIGYNQQRKVADWVAYYVTRETAHSANVDRGEFAEDPDIDEQFRSDEDDYDEPLYDRGHLAPSAAIDFNREANDETFLYSNMTPQLAGFNRNAFGRTGVWGAIEDRNRRLLANDRSKLLVFAGTFFEAKIQTIGDDVGVPARFFKIVYDPIEVSAIAYWMPQDEDTRHLIQNYVTTIDFIESQTGFDFLTELDNNVAVVVEAAMANVDDW